MIASPAKNPGAVAISPALHPLARYVPSGFTALESCGEADGCVLVRGLAPGGSRVLVKTPAGERSPRETEARLAHEFALRSEIDPAWAARPTQLSRVGSVTALVMEDPGGTPLDRLYDGRVDTARFLRVAISLCDALSGVHDRGLIHKDVKPAHVLVDPDGERAWLTGFGIASRLPRERQAPGAPEAIAGTLAFMAPEQTGRMNRTVDSRSDLYSLGVVLYRMLTGVLPFVASDPIDQVHCLVAREPRAPSERAPDVPEAVSAVVMKLLAKTPEDRYQTAAGVRADLARCLSEWEVHGNIAPFTPGFHDASDRLRVPEKLYGRERESRALVEAFRRVVADGTPQLVLVRGHPGIGKTSLVSELHKVIVLPRGLFASGKFDRYKRDIPYATLAGAFRSLVRQILVRSRPEVDAWASAIRDALGPNAQLVVDLVPELEFVVGKQPPVPEVPPQEAQNRFQEVLRRFLQVFAQPEHPLALFLDDLQWLDVATLKLLEHLATHPDIRHLLLIGAYRDTEVGPAHPLALTLDAIRKAGVAMHEIVLEPLSAAHVGLLVADTLRCGEGAAAPLARLVHEKTAGNPFFVIQFLTALAEQGFLAYDARRQSWQWDLASIRARGFTDNVVELMLGQLQRLPSATRDTLQTLACLGDGADAATLALACGRTEDEVHARIWDAVLGGFVYRVDARYDFLHDRVREAAYAMIPPEERPAVHLRIGRRLLAGLPESVVAERVFEVVNQLDRGSELVDDPREKAVLRGLNTLAGRRARAAIAYTSAQAYLARATTLLPPDAWNAQYEETFRLYLERSECEYLVGTFGQAIELFDRLLEHARSNLDRAKVYSLRMRLYQVAGRYDEGVSIALQALELFGVTVPEEDAALKEALEAEVREVAANLRGRSIAEILDAPAVADPDVRATIALLVDAEPCAYIGRPKVFPLLAMKAANLSLRHGNTEESCFAYSAYGLMLVSVFGDIPSAYAFSEMSLRLNEKLGDARLRGTLLHLHGDHIHFWRRPFATGLPILDRAFRACVEVGDLVYAGYLAFETVWQWFEMGQPLDQVLDGSRKYAAFARASHNEPVAEVLRAEQRFFACLQGKTRAPASFEGPGFDEAQCLETLTKATFGCGVVFFHIMKQIAAYTFGRYADALESAERAAPQLGAAMAMPIEATYHFYLALTLAALHDGAPEDRKPELARRLAEELPRLKLWAENCPENFGNRYALVLAEQARVEGRDLDAMRRYEEAIRAARENGFVQNEGLAHELAARFYLARGFERIAVTYLREARDCFASWGAQGKVAQLEATHPQVRVPAAPPATREALALQLDVVAVVRACQAVSREIAVEPLIQTLVRLAVEHAGAQRGLLLLPRGEEHRIEAEAWSEGDAVAVRLRPSATTSGELAESVLNYVTRTREVVILDDAAAHGIYSDDPYVVAKRPRSVLCLPLLQQGRLVGAIYLENNLVPRAFTPDRLAVLDIIASQAAISLEIARAYSALAAERARLQAVIQRVPAGLLIAEAPSGRLLVGNDHVERIFRHPFQPAANIEEYDRYFGFHPDGRRYAPSEWPLARAIRAGEVVEGEEMEVLRGDGSRGWVSVSAAPIRDEDGHVFAAVVVLMDVTERKLAERELASLNLELEARVRARTQELEVANRELESFSYTVSHDLRAPLRAISGYTSLLRQDHAAALPEEGRRLLALVAKASERMGSLIEDLLRLSHVTRLTMAPCDVDLGALAEEVVRDLRAASPSRRVDVAIAPRVRAHADPRLLRIALENLLGNAWKFTSKRDRAEIAFGERTVGGERVFFVRDNGAGFDTASATKLFTPFQRYHGIRDFEGTGVGLATVHRVVSRHGGRVWAESRVGQGATFYFTLPEGG